MSDSNNQHQIIPPLKLFREWTEYRGAECEDQFWWRIATQAARWGADQELEACINYFLEYDSSWGENSELITGLRAARRPKPPSLAEQALTLINKIQGNLKTWQLNDLDVVRTALERLQELENNG